MSYQPVGFTRHNPDPEKTDFDRPTREPASDPLEDAFGDTFWASGWQVDGVVDENGGKHYFWRCYATKPCRTLIDRYRILPNPIEFEDGDVSEAVTSMRELAIAKASKIAAQLEVYNAANPSERYGLIQVIGDDVVEKTEVARAADGGAWGQPSPTYTHKPTHGYKSNCR